MQNYSPSIQPGEAASSASFASLASSASFAPLRTLAQALAARPLDATAGWRANRVVSWGDLAARTGAWATLLAAQPGRNHALYLEDSLEFACALLGAWQAGKTVWLPADTVDATCAALRAQVDGFIGAFPASCAPLAAPAPVSVAAHVPDFHALDPAMDALVVYTSGSTGEPQAVPKRLSQLDSEVAVLEHMFGQAAGDAVVVATVSHQHIYGLLFKVLWPLCAARRVHAISAVYPEELVTLLAEQPALLVGSPAHLKRLPPHLDWSGPRKHLRAVYSSGGPLPPEAALACIELLGAAPVEVYGSSETGGVARRQRTLAADSLAVLDAASANWLTFPNVDWRIGDDQHGEHGEHALLIRSPHLPPQAADAWYALADRVGSAPDGRFALLGRADRIVKIEEKRVSLDALEAALLATGLVAEGRVLPDDGARMRLAAFAVLTEAGSALLAQQGKLALNRRLRSALAGVAEAVALPRRWRYLDALPVNAQGKVTRAALLALLEPLEPDYAPHTANEPAPAPAMPWNAAWDARPRAPQVLSAERGERSVSLQLGILVDLLYFEGHFPVAPILPGVAQLDWAIAFGRNYFPLPPVFREVAALKFQQVIVPGATVTLELQHDTVKGSLQFRYLSDAGQHASGRVLFAPAQPE